MFAKLNNLIDSFKRSLWLIPLCMTIAGLALSFALYQLDWVVWERRLPFLGEEWGIDSEGIRVLFSNIGAAIITAMTTILSITLLIFTVLAGQFGAHILRVFKIQTFSKFVIGWFAGTYIYIIFNIYKVTSSDDGYIPQISITVGIILTLATIFLLIFYIHFLVRQIQASTVVSEIGEELNRSIKAMDEYTSEEEEGKAIFLPEEAELLENAITLEQSGYIQSVDKDTLRDIAEEKEIVLKVNCRTGHFVVTGTQVAAIYSREEPDDHLFDKVRSCFLLGEKRIPVEDLECNLELLVEMALRGLSPGINDIMVANQCIDYIGESIALLQTRRFPPVRLYAEDGRLLLIAKEFSFEGYVNAALNPLRQYSRKHCSTTVRLLDTLLTLLKLVKVEGYQKVLARHFSAIYQGALQEHDQDIDLASLDRRMSEFQQLMKEKGAGFTRPLL